MAKEIPVPDELKILLPELNKGTIVVGAKAYEMLPLYEGQLEKIISGIATLMEKVNCPDGQCPKCGKVVKGALPKKVFKCPDDNEDLMTMNDSAMKAIIESSKIPEWVETITGVPGAEVKASMTLKQIKHFAGLFWKLNFSEGGMPEESQANFERLLEMMGEKAGKKTEAKTEISPAEKIEDKPQV
jgi:hypothetical protein